MEIKLLSSNEITQHYQQIVEIFWLTSTKTKFDSSDEKNLFQQKYLDSYLSKDFVFVALQNEVLGYLLWRVEKREENFLTLYPSHLHINCHPLKQGKGIGGKLIDQLKIQLSNKNINGVHLITLYGHQNMSFYQKNEFKILHPLPPKINAPVYLGYSLNKKG